MVQGHSVEENPIPQQSKKAAQEGSSIGGVELWG